MSSIKLKNSNPGTHGEYSYEFSGFKAGYNGFTGYLLPAEYSGSEKMHGLYKKWLRYYLDFCKKYDFPADMAGKKRYASKGAPADKFL